MRTVQLDAGIHRTDAPNGAVVVTERLSGVRSAAAGIWVRTASAHETPEVLGVSHLLEHMVFKGTVNRSAREIATSLESRGGSLDAYTSRDHTSYQAHVLDQDLPVALDVLVDLVTNPLLRADDLALERNVVLEEINGMLDTPDDLVHEIFNRTLYPSHPYGWSILGSPETVGTLTADDLRAAHGRGYYPGNTVVAVAGNIQHQQVLDRLEELGWFAGEHRPPLEPVAPASSSSGLRIVQEADLQQSHIVLGSATIPSRDPRRWGMALLTSALGSGMSSRLFQKVREERGLCYAIYAWHGTYRAGGNAGIYLGTQPGTADEAVTAVDGELRKLAAEGLPADELADIKNQVKGQMMLALENTTSRMSRLAAHVLQDDRYRSLDDVLRLVDAVTPEETAALAAEFLAPERMSAVRLGPVN